MSVPERIFGRHCNSEFPHAVSQLSPSLPSFHALIPSAVHSSSVDMAMLLLKSRRPEPTSLEPYLPAAQSKHVLATEAPVAVEYFPAAQSTQILAPGASEYLPAVQAVHAPTTLQCAEKPKYSIVSSDVKTTWRKPVVDVNLFVSLTNPDRLTMSERGEHKAEEHW